MQTGLPMSTIIILSAVIPSTLVLLMLVCTVVVIILIVRWRITRKQVDAAHEQFEINTNDAYTTSTIEVSNVAYVTAEDTIPATQNVAYGQVPPGTDEYEYVIN